MVTEIKVKQKMGTTIEKSAQQSPNGYCTIYGFYWTSDVGASYEWKDKDFA